MPQRILGDFFTFLSSMYVKQFENKNISINPE